MVTGGIVVFGFLFNVVEIGLVFAVAPAVGAVLDALVEVVVG